MEDPHLNEFLHNVANLWLLTGILLVIVDTVHLGGIGLLFAGLGAVVVGASIYLGLLTPEAHVAQFLLCFVSTAVWVVFLWKPIKKFRLATHVSEYHNIVGETAYVGSGGLSRQSGGEVTWSGTIMKGELAKNVSVDTLDAGSQVIIVGVSGATLIVKPKE